MQPRSLRSGGIQRVKNEEKSIPFKFRMKDDVQQTRLAFRNHAICKIQKNRSPQMSKVGNHSNPPPLLNDEQSIPLAGGRRNPYRAIKRNFRKQIDRMIIVKLRRKRKIQRCRGRSN